MIRFLALSIFIFAIFSDPLTTANGDVNFSLSGATSRSYKTFIANMRKALPSKDKVYDIPVLLPTASGKQRFILINLSNYVGQTITVAIDVLNVYVVAYRTGDVSYFFQGAPDEASRLLFKDTTQKLLPHTGNYENLQTAARKTREKIELGLPALDSAITTLFYYNAESAASAFLVLIQTTSEAARFKYIEVQIANNVGSKFKPNLAIISLENNWSALSKQIQIAQNREGQFETPVVLVNLEDKRVEITNVTSKVVTSNIELLLYKGNVATAHDEIPATPFTRAISDRDEEIVAMMPSNCGYKMRSKSIDNGHENYVTV